MTVGQEVEGDRLGDVGLGDCVTARPRVTYCLRSPGYVREGKVLRVFSSGRYFSRNQE